MTRDNDIERVLDRFYAEGPAEMPDRVLLRVFDRIERVPQRRLAFLTRFATMNTNLRLAAAAAIVVAVVGVGAFALSQRTSVGPQATATVSPSLGPTPGAGLSAIPAALAYTWIGPPRTVPEISPPLNESALVFNPYALRDNDLLSNYVLYSTAGLSTPDTIVFTLTRPENGCQSGDVGSYTFALAPDGTSLTLTTVAEACAARSSAISGAWNRTHCPDPTTLIPVADPEPLDPYVCLDDMDPGTHVSALFNPFVAPAAWVRNYGALSFQVPAGWRNTDDCRGCYALAKQGPQEIGREIVLVSDAAARSQDASCLNALEPGVGRTPAALANWLKSLPGVAATTPAPISIGGLSGMTLDLAVATTWTHSCPNTDTPSVPTLVSADRNGFEWDVSSTMRERLILLDTGGGRTLLLAINAPDKASFDAFVGEAMSVIQTFQFKR